MKSDEIAKVLSDAKKLAKRYKELTGKPLGITGEVAEFSAAQILGLDLVGARQPGYDAIRIQDGKEIKFQIKGRCVSGSTVGSKKIGSIRLKYDWDLMVFVLLDEDFEVLSIYEATREQVINALKAPGSKARNERGQLSISKFKSIGQEIWSK